MERIFCFFIIAFSILLFAAGCSSKITKTSGLEHRDISPTFITSDTLEQGKVILGCENFLKNYLHLVKGRRIGLLTNSSGVNRHLQSTADIFAGIPDINLTALFGPEHGIRGAIYAGDEIADETDARTGVPVFSLYGKTLKPTREMLKNVDVLIVDIQDIGVRGYTYIYSMAKVLEAAAEFNKEVLVLDRPNPIGGTAVEGNLVREGFFSFVGLYPIPYRYGMTIGELARLFNSEFDINCKLTVIPLLNWQREMLWRDTGLPWVPPSPHAPHWETVLFMSATGTLGELHALSEGVGYTSPFEMIGAPWINGQQLADSLNALNLPGILFRPLYYKPYYATYKGEICQGVQLHITSPEKFNSYSAGLHIMHTVLKLYPDHDLFANQDRLDMFCKIVGSDWILNDLKNHVPVCEMEAKWQDELNEFKKIRKKYLIY